MDFSASDRAAALTEQGRSFVTERLEPVAAAAMTAKNFIMRIKMVLKSDYRVGYARRFVVSLEDAENCNTPACLYTEDR